MSEWRDIALPEAVVAKLEAADKMLAALQCLLTFNEGSELANISP